MITFGIELTDEQLDIIEANCHIPAKIGTVYINAKSSGHAMRIFKKQYGIKKSFSGQVIYSNMCMSFVQLQVMNMFYFE